MKIIPYFPVRLRERDEIAGKGRLAAMQRAFYSMKEGARFVAGGCPAACAGTAAARAGVTAARAGATAARAGMTAARAGATAARAGMAAAHAGTTKYKPFERRNRT
jgi:hypothetical protein